MPLGFNPRPDSRQVSEGTRWGFPHAPPQDYTGEVATDGGCVDTHGGRAGWGLVFESHGSHSMAGPLPGPWQAAQRAEVYAVLMAVTAFTGPLVVLTDSRYVHDRLDRLLRGG